MTLKFKKTLQAIGICILSWIYALVFAALASACSSDNETGGGSVEKTASLRLSISGGNAGQTRATADALPRMKQPFIG